MCIHRTPPAGLPRGCGSRPRAGDGAARLRRTRRADRPTPSRDPRPCERSSWIPSRSSACSCCSRSSPSSSTSSGSASAAGGRIRLPGEQEGPTDMLVGSLLALMAFLLAITMGMAADRFDTRGGRSSWTRQRRSRRSYLQAGYLPPAEGDQIRELLRQYASLRIASQRPREAPGERQPVRSRSTGTCGRSRSRSCRRGYNGDVDVGVRRFADGPHHAPRAAAHRGPWCAGAPERADAAARGLGAFAGHGRLQRGPRRQAQRPERRS